MISIPDDLKAMMDEYNSTHFEKIHLSEITQRALYEKITGKEARTPSTIIAETITNAISQEPKACKDDFFGNKCDKTKEEPIIEAPNKDRKRRVYKPREKKHKRTCFICGREFMSASHNKNYCGAPCERHLTEKRIEEIRNNPALWQPLS